MTNQAIETGYHVTRVFLDGATQPVDDGDEVLTAPQVSLDGRRYVLVGQLPSEPAARASCVEALLAFAWDEEPQAVRLGRVIGRGYTWMGGGQ